jgi:hypothetical protein
MDDVGIVSCTAPFHQGTVSTGMHKKSIRIELVDRRKIGFYPSIKPRILNMTHASFILRCLEAFY